MQEKLLYDLALILLLGTAAQWMGWRFGIPSILLLLVTGLVFGPWLGILTPDADFPNLILPVTSLGVAVILFEGGLNLKVSELRQSGWVIGRLVTIGALVSAALSALAAHWVLGFDVSVALVFGAVLVITGPTVIMPMLRQIRPRGRINHVLKWEGIVNDPVGAVLAVLMLEAALLGSASQAPGLIMLGIGKTLLVGVLGSVAGALLLVVAYRRNWVPDYLHNPVALAVAIGLFVGSNYIQKEAGLLTVTLLGIFLANQKSFPVRHIVEFKENLQVLLIAGLFVVLSARVEPEVLAEIGWPSIAFILLAVLVIRPLSIIASTVGTDLDWRERIFLMFMAPRGIVVTALASLFAFRLSEMGNDLGERMFAEVLFVVIGTVTIYGLAAGPVARALGLGTSNPRGLLIVGAHPFARLIGVALRRFGIPPTFIDSNEGNIEAAREAGLTAHAGNIHSEDFLSSIDFSDIGKALALTANDEINAFAQHEMSKFVGRANVYALPQRRPEAPASIDRHPDAAFGNDMTFNRLEGFFYSGAVVRSLTVTEQTSWEELREKEQLKAIPLFQARTDGTLQVHTEQSPIETLRKGTNLIFLSLDAANPRKGD